MAMFFAAALFGILMAPEGETGAGGPTGGSQNPPQPATPFAVFPDAESFNKRMSQAERAALKREFGTDDVAVIKARMARAKELEDAEAERKKQEMTELDRLKQEKAEAERLAQQRADDLEQERLGRLIASECAKRSIKSVDYAAFLIEQGTARLPQGQQLDVGAYLDEQLKDDTTKVALGIVVPAPTLVLDPANTDPKGAPPLPPPPAAGGTGPAVVDAMAMDAQAWSKKKQELGI